MSQSINLANVGAVNFNGSTVKQINLNGASIWTGSVSVDIWGTWYQNYGEKIINEGAIGKRTDKSLVTGTDGTTRWITALYKTESYPRTYTPTFKGYEITAFNTSVLTQRSGAVLAVPNEVFGNGTITIQMAGYHPQDFFTSVTVNGHTFNTLDTDYFRRSYNAPSYYDGGVAAGAPATQWIWDLQTTGTEYYVLNKNQWNSVEFV